MPSVSHLMKVPLDSPDLDIPLTPVGTWKGDLVKITYKDKDEDGGPLTDRNGDEYAMVRLICRPKEPEADVNKREAEAWLKAGGAAETVLNIVKFVRGKRGMSAIGKLLKSLGVPVAGRSIEQVAKEYKGGVPVRFEVSHGEYNGEPVENIDEIYPAT